MGVTTAERGEVADLVLINTCTVTETASQKCRQMIHRMVRQHPGAYVVVTGCYAQLDPDAVEQIPGVSLTLGANEKARLIQFLSEAWGEKQTHVERHTKDIRSFAPSCSRGSRTRYFLKVQDGCDYFCTYCAIPFARGFSRNPTIDSLVLQAQQAVAEGGKEIVLTGVNIGDFGKTTGERFIDLVKALDTRVPGIARYRISSLEPDLLTDDLIAYCAESPHFMPHFHIPLQSGADEVLRLMHRHYDSRLFADKVRRVVQLMPDAFIGVDVMVGCRGEREELFRQTFDLLSDLPVAQLHVFPYSERPGTAALRIPHTVSEAEKRERSHQLLALSDEKLRAFYARYRGTQAEVLFERAARGRAMHGFTRNYIRVELPAAEASPALDNELRIVTLGDLNAKGDALKTLEVKSEE